MITFKQQITVPEELVGGLAEFLGYEQILKTEFPLDEPTKDGDYFEIREEKNPESAEEYVDRKAKEHTQGFFKPFGDKLVELELAKLGIDEQKQEAKEQIEKRIIDPVINNLFTEIITK